MNGILFAPEEGQALSLASLCVVLKYNAFHADANDGIKCRAYTIFGQHNMNGKLVWECDGC